MQRVFENSVTITCTHNDKKVNAEIDNFKFQESLNAFLATNKIHMKYKWKVDKLQMKYKWKVNKLQMKYKWTVNEIQLKSTWNTNEK